MKDYNKLIFELSKPCHKGYSLPDCSFANDSIESLIPQKFIRKTAPNLPEVSEVDVVRHYTNISNKNYGVDTGFL
jgi:glycine dehydrogenase subunit 2